MIASKKILALKVLGSKGFLVQDPRKTFKMAITIASELSLLSAGTRWNITLNLDFNDSFIISKYKAFKHLS